MESDKPTIEELITTVLIDIQQKGYSAVQPFSIGEVEQRMMVFAKTNGITLASDQLYVSAKQLQHFFMKPSGKVELLIISALLQPCHRSSHRGSTWFHLSRCKDKKYF